jgi:hypothetical protein
MSVKESSNTSTKYYLLLLRGWLRCVVNKEKNGTITVEGDKDHPVNKGHALQQGLNLHYTVNDKSDRCCIRKCGIIKACPCSRLAGMMP